MASPTEITPQQLARLIGTPDCPVLIDLRIDEDFAKDPRLMPGAWHHPRPDTAGLAARLGGQKAVLFCQGAAAILRANGTPAEALEGGFAGWAAARLPLVSTARLPPRNPQGQTVWVARHRGPRSTGSPAPGSCAALAIRRRRCCSWRRTTAMSTCVSPSVSSRGSISKPMWRCAGAQARSRISRIRPEVWLLCGPTWLPVTAPGGNSAALCCIFSRSGPSLESGSQTRWVRLRMPKSIGPPPEAQLSISPSGKAARSRSRSAWVPRVWATSGTGNTRL